MVDVKSMEDVKVYGAKMGVDIVALILCGAVAVALAVSFFGANLMTFFTTILP